MRNIKNQAILLHWVNGEKLYDKKTQKLLNQISQSND